MGYLICKLCGGCYELQKDESPEDFDVCSCGGELEYRLSSDDLERSSYDVEGEKKSNKKLIIILAVAGLFLILIFLVLPALLIYNSYFSGPSGLNSSMDVQQVRPSRMVLPLLGYYW